MKNTTMLKLSYQELTALADLMYIGNEIINELRKKRIQKYDNLFDKIAEVYQAKTIELHPEKTEECSNIQEYISGHCRQYMMDHDDAYFPELLAAKLAFSLDTHVPRLRDKIIKAKIFKKE